MPVATATENKPLIPAGEHHLTLRDVETKIVDNPYKLDGAGNPTKQERWIWHFVADLADADGVPYEYDLWTGNSYGAPQAGLTQLYDSIMPGITVAQATTFNTDKLLNRKFVALIKHETGDNGKVRSRLVRIALQRGTPAVAAPAAAPAAPPVQEFDPFKDE